MPEAGTYKLPDDLAEQIFREDIAPERLEAQASSNPTVLFVTGQPGAGKSASEVRLRAALQLTDAVGLDADDLRVYHPDHALLSRLDDRTASAHTHPDARRWLDMAIDTCIQQRADVVVSATFGDPQSGERQIQRFREAGYKVEVAAIGVHQTHSELSVVERYQSAREKRGFGRYVPEDIRDSAYEGLPDTVAHVETGKLADAVYVYDRGGHQVYANHLVDGEWERPPAAVDMLQRTREQNLLTDAQWFAGTATGLQGSLAPDLAQQVERFTRNAVAASRQLGADPGTRQLYEKAAAELAKPHGIDVEQDARESPSAPREPAHEAEHSGPELED
jgi:UDP-N-acetylglucosamine kinase